MLDTNIIKALISKLLAFCRQSGELKFAHFVFTQPGLYWTADWVATGSISSQNCIHFKDFVFCGKRENAATFLHG